MLRSGIQLVKSHGDDLGLEYLWNGDEYSSLENSLKAIVKDAERSITVHYEDSDKGTVVGEFFTDRPNTDILYYPEERGGKGELL